MLGQIGLGKVIVAWRGQTGSATFARKKGIGKLIVVLLR